MGRYIGSLLVFGSRWFFLIAAVMVRADGPVVGPSMGDLAQVEHLQNTLAAVAEAVRPSVVAVHSRHRISSFGYDDLEIHSPGGEGHRGPVQRWFPAVGSGFVIRSDGLVLTNEHVIRDADPKSITCALASGETYTVRGMTSDPRSDLAVLRIDAKGLKPVKLGDLEGVKQGHFAIAMGNPFGFATEARGRPAMSFGVISALGRPLTRQLDPKGERYYGNLIQTDARINPGNSGGPLLNIKGEVIGINIAISTRSGGNEGAGFAVSMDRRVKQIIAQLVQGKEVEYGYLGIVLGRPTAKDRQLTGAPDTGGALIAAKVEPDSPAAAAHLQAGDIVVEFDGQPVVDEDHLIRLVGAARVGVAVEVALFRHHKRLTVAVTPTRRETIKGIRVDVSSPDAQDN